MLLYTLHNSSLLVSQSFFRIAAFIHYFKVLFSIFYELQLCVRSYSLSPTFLLLLVIMYSARGEGSEQPLEDINSKFVSFTTVFIHDFSEVAK